MVVSYSSRLFPGTYYRLEGIEYRFLLVLLGGLALTSISFFLSGDDMTERYANLIRLRAYSEEFERTTLNAYAFELTQTWGWLAIPALFVAHEKHARGFLWWASLFCAIVFAVLGVSRRAFFIPIMLCYFTLLLYDGKWRVRVIIGITVPTIILIAYGKEFLSTIAFGGAVADLSGRYESFAAAMLRASSEQGITIVESRGTLTFLDDHWRLGADHLLSIARKFPFRLLGWDAELPKRMVRISTEAFASPEAQDIPPGLMGQMWLDFRVLGPVAWGLFIGVQLSVVQFMRERWQRSLPIQCAGGANRFFSRIAHQYGVLRFYDQHRCNCNNDRACFRVSLAAGQRYKMRMSACVSQWIIVMTQLFGLEHAAAKNLTPMVRTDSAALSADLQKNPCYTRTVGALSKPGSEIHIRSEDDVRRIRVQLMRQIWPDGFPSDTLPTTDSRTSASNAESNASGLYRSLTEESNAVLRSERRLTVDVGFGFKSVIYFWEPRAPNERLFLIHDGHADDSYGPDGEKRVRAMVNATNFVTVKTLLAKGFAVMWLQMPLYGDNFGASQPKPPYSALCGVQCDRHAEIFRAFADSAVSPLIFFLQPVIVAINYAVTERNYSDISMMGSSGGGWTTVLAAALDPRIAASVSVAGSVPLFLHTGVCGKASIGDAEQENQRGLLYKRISYSDLYIMAADGSKRLHLQVNNQFDTCCFFGISYTKYAAYLSEYVTKHGLGAYRFHLDSAFVGHGYDATAGGAPANNTLENVVLPAIAKPI